MLPSYYEGHPKTLLEAMACGLAVITTDVPGIREIIRHRENGFLTGTSPSDLRQAITEVVSDPRLRDHMGSNARQYILERFRLDRIVDLELGRLAELVAA